MLPNKASKSSLWVEDTKLYRVFFLDIYMQIIWKGHHLISIILIDKQNKGLDAGL